MASFDKTAISTFFPLGRISMIPSSNLHHVRKVFAGPTTRVASNLVQDLPRGLGVRAGAVSIYPASPKKKKNTASGIIDALRWNIPPKPTSHIYILRNLKKKIHEGRPQIKKAWSHIT